MAREIVIWCDPCMAEETRTPASEHSVGLALDATKAVATRTIAMCDSHRDQYLKGLEALLDEFGVPLEVAPPKKPASQPASRRVVAGSSGNGYEQALINFEQTGTRKGKPPKGERTAECLWCPLTYANDSASGLGRHLKVAHGFQGLRGAFGGPCPICGEGPYELMMSHINKSHPEFEFKSVTQAFLWARDNGDPHGVYHWTVNEKTPDLDPETAWAETREKERPVHAKSEAKRKSKPVE